MSDYEQRLFKGVLSSNHSGIKTEVEGYLFRGFWGDIHFQWTEQHIKLGKTFWNLHDNYL